MKEYSKVEKCLKGFLKNSKRISYSVALLVSFLINGGFLYANEATNGISRDDIQSKIDSEQKNISQALNEVDKEMAEIDLKLKKIMQRGEFWVKPLKDSYQIFFNGSWKNKGKNRNRTRNNFKEAEYTSEGGKGLDYGRYYKGIYYGEEGIIKNPLEFVDNIDFGANITPKSVQEKVINEKTVSLKTVALPSAQAPNIKISDVKVETPTAPTIATLVTPASPNINVTAPGSIVPIEQISVTEIIPLNMNVSIPSVTNPAGVQAPIVQAPVTPGGFNTRLVSLPLINTRNIDISPVPDPPSTDVAYQDVPNNKTGFDKDGSFGNNGIIAQLDLTEGTYNVLLRGADQDIDYKFLNAATSTTGYLNEADFNNSIMQGTVGRNAFYAIGGKAVNKIEAPVVINAVGNNTGPQALSSIFYLGNHNNAGTQESKLENYGTVNLYGNKIAVVNIDNVTSDNNITFVNKGKIIGHAESNNAEYTGSTNIGNYIFGGYSYGDQGVDTIENATEGSVIFYAPNSVGWAYTSSSNQEIKRSSINNGAMKLYGHHSLGIATDNETTVDQMSWADIQLNSPIQILGDESVGASIRTEPDESRSSNFFDSKWNIQVGGLNGETQNATYGNTKDDIKKVEQSVGLNFDFTTHNSGIQQRKINKYKVSLEDDSANSVGIRVGKAKIQLNNADSFTNLTLKGENNVGYLADGVDSELEYNNTRNNGAITLGSNAKNNVLFAAKSSGKLNIMKKLELGNTNSEGFLAYYAKDANSVVTQNEGFTINHSGKNSSVAYGTNSGKIEIKNTAITLPSIPNSKAIVNSNSLPSSTVTLAGEGSVGYYAESGANIVSKNSNSKILNGSSLAYSKGANSKIDISNSLLDYSGDGYSLYTENNGKIVADNSVLVLRGNAVGMKVASVKNNDISFTNGKIVMMSNNAIPFIASDITSTVNVDNILTGLGLSSSTMVVKGKDGTTEFNKYRIAAVDGMTKLSINQNLDKKDAIDDNNETSSDLSKKSSYELFRRYLIQRAKVELDNHQIKAVLNPSDLNKLDVTQVVGLEMNSSKSATSVDETGIELKNNSKIIADRDGNGAGAIGAFINYGKVDVDASSKILVEKEANTVNDKAVGIYAVNGSIVNNKGEVSVGGDQSIGILGMAYRLDGSNTPIVDEFGNKATGQGKVNITNDAGSKIVMSGENSIGIYAENNKTGSSVTDNNIVNKGEITVANSADNKVAIGIYADNVTVKPEDGNVNIGKGAIGIYSKNSAIGEQNKNLGTVNFKGENGVALYLTGEENKSSLAGNKITLTNTDSKKGNVGIYIDYKDESNKAIDLTTKVETTSDNITAYYTKTRDLKVKTDLKINKNSVGITGAEGKALTYGDDNTNHTLEVGEKSIGILGNKSSIGLESKANIKLVGNGAVGVYSDTDSIANKNLTLKGNVNIETDKGIGVYSLNGTVNVNPIGADVKFGNNAKNSIAYYLAGSKWNGPTSYGASSTNLTYAHDSNNIYLYGQAAKSSDGTTKGSVIHIGEVLNISPTGVATADKKATGIYLNTLVKGTNNEYADNILQTSEAGAQINVVNKAIGVYAENASDSKYNEIQKPEIVATGEETVGVYTNGNLKLASPRGTIVAKQKAIGIYGNKGNVFVEDKQNIELEEQGTGVYLTNGSHLENGELILENKTANKVAAGVYYTKGNSNAEVKHNTKLTSEEANSLIALYVDGGINLKNEADIKLSSTNNASKNVAAYITKNSKFTNTKNISLQNLDDSTGIYVTDGEAINDVNGKITVLDNVANKLSAGMAASKAVGATKAKVENKGMIDVTGEAIGMYIADNSVGINSGKILAKNNSTNKAIGVYVTGENASFDGSNGEISSENIALALKGTKENKIKAGTLKLTSDNSVGVYADSSVVDFDVEVKTTKDKTVALYAKGATKIKNKITSAEGKGHVGVYVADNNVSFDKNSNVVVKNGIGTDYGVGIYTAKGYTGNISTNIKQEGKETIGLYLGNDGSTGSKVEHSGNINSGKGIGVYIPEKSEFIAKNTTFNVDGGTAVYLKGGKVDLGKEGNATINFGNNGGTAIVQDGGDISTGSNLTINGKGSFVAVKNGNPKINSAIKVGESGIGINSIYDKAGNDYNVVLDSPNGKIQLDGNKATGIAATVANTVSPNSVTIKNKGSIETLSGQETVGIFSKGANIENSGKISIGANGVAIYSTNENANINTKLNNTGEIELLENEAKGIVINKGKTNQAVSVGKISGSKDKQIGVYVKNSEDNLEVKDAKINLGTNAKGLVFEEGKDFKLTATATNKNKITIGDTTDLNNRGIAVSAIGVNGEISNTDITVGAKSLGLYVKDKQVKFDLASGSLKSTDGSSILAYADGNTSKIEVNGGGTLKVSENGIALGTNKGQIEADENITVEVNGANGIGAYVNGGGVSNKIDVKVKSAGGIGVYAKGNINSLAKVSEVKGNKSKAYIFEDISNSTPVEIATLLKLDDKNATEQVGVYAKGSGSGLKLNGISVEGSKNIGVYSETGKSIENNGILKVGDSIGESSVGIYSKNGEVKQIGEVTVGKKSIGINTSKAGVSITGNVDVKDEAIGLYVANTKLDEGDTRITGNLTVRANKAIGVQVSNSKVSLTGDLKVGAEDSKGIFSEGTGNIELGSNIEVAKNSVAVYKKGTGTESVKTTSGKTISVEENAYGIFTKNAAVDNKANLNIGKNAIGIYTDNANINSKADVKVTGEGGVGLLLKGNNKLLSSTGTVETTAGKAVGIYANGANINQVGDVKVANNDSIGIYSKGEGNITTSGNMIVGKDSIAIYKDGQGTIKVGTSGANQTLTINDKGYGIYYKGSSNTTNNKIVSNMNMTLAKEAVGIYGKNTEIDQTGDITVGETIIGSNGFNDPEENRNSIGIFGDNSNINYKGNMLVDKALSVGIYANNGGAITVKNGSTITVKNGATGLMTAKGAKGITVENGATINVQGKANDPRATEKNVSYGIVANSGEIDNKGTINVKDGATGIYVAGTAYLKNGATGTIVVDANSKSLSSPSKSSADIGGIKVTDKGKVTIGERVINGGTVKIKGDLNMQGMGIDISTGKTIIDARTISGTAYVTPDFSKGNSEQKITIKDVFRTSPEGIGNFSGDVKSKSVSWIAKISKDPNDTTTTTKDITMVRLPYNSLIAGDRYKNLANGLENVRANISKNIKSPVFQSLDRISSHGEFAKAISNIRGDVYSNIQERMRNIEYSFDKSYDELLDSYNVTRDVNKFSVISTKGKHKDNTIGVLGYEYNTIGALYLNDREGFRYGEKYGWSAGLVGSHFDFEGKTNKGSKENVISGKVGIHYQKALDRKDDNARLKWLTRGELTVNSHKTKRNSQIGKDLYKNRANFYSTELSWKNRLFYDYDLNTNWTLKPYTGLDISYGYISKISEHGEGLKLDVKGEDYLLISPKFGVETKYTVPITQNHQLLVKADAELGYDVTELYKEANKAKLKDSGAGYYKLSEPESRRAKMAIGLELGIEKENTYGLTFRTEYRGDKKEDLNYGLRLNYKF